MASRSKVSDRVELQYKRVPITAERPPDFSDFSELIALAVSANMAHIPIVVNDQLGRGRSTLTTIILVLIQRWLSGTRLIPTTPRFDRRMSSMTSSVSAEDLAGMNEVPIRRQSYQVINSTS